VLFCPFFARPKLRARGRFRSEAPTALAERTGGPSHRDDLRRAKRTQYVMREQM
jgi:hypothetical protein